MGSLQRIFKLVIKELHLLKSDKRALFMAILLPPLIMAAFSSMAVLSGLTGTTTVRIAIVNYDDLYSSYTLSNGSTIQSNQNSWGQVLINTLKNSNLTEIEAIYNINITTYGMLYARQLLQQQKIDAIVTIPSEFSEAIQYKFPALIEIIPDGSDVSNLRTVLNNIQQILTEFQQTNNITPYFRIESDIEFTTGGGGSDLLGFVSALSVPFLIIGATLILTLLVIVKEAPLARLLMTPAKKSEILLAKYITYGAIMTFQIFLIFIVNTIIGLKVAGSLLDFFIAMLLVGLYGISLGILISTLASTEIQANEYFLEFS